MTATDSAALPTAERTKNKYNKGFGALGGAILLGTSGMEGSRNRDAALRFGVPLTWSQRVDVDQLRKGLRAVVDRVDELVGTPAAGNRLPIRFVTLKEEERTIESAFACEPGDATS
nr:hypothetical protein [Rhodococcus sp. (in: high G+C Gram-positive bacteria)]